MNHEESQAMGSAMTLETLRDLLLHAKATSMIGTHIQISVADAAAGVLAIDARLADKAGARIDGWLPIESAPKSVADGRHIDGIYLLGFVPEADAVDLKSCIRIIWWEPLLIGKNGNKGKWVCDAMDVSIECEPTHWMTLPEAPCAQ